LPNFSGDRFVVGDAGKCCAFVVLLMLEAECASDGSTNSRISNWSDCYKTIKIRFIASFVACQCEGTT
jgi:hypothetical protein